MVFFSFGGISGWEQTGGATAMCVASIKTGSDFQVRIKS